MSETKLTPELREAICGYIAEGVPIRQACTLSHIGKSSHYRWLEQAGVDEEAGITDSVYVAFAEAVDLARAQFVHNVIQHVGDTNDKNWTRWAWKGERLAREIFALNSRVEVAGPDGEPVQIVVKFEGKPKDNDREDAETAGAA